MTRRGRAAALIAVVTVLATLSGCGSRTLSTSGVEAQISARLARDHAPVRVGATTCPSVPRPAKGARFTCRTAVGDQTVGVDVAMTDADGHLAFVTTRSIVARAEVERDLEKRLHDAYDEPGDVMAITATCPGAAVRVLAVDATFRCTVKTGDSTASYVVTVADRAGNVTYRSTS
jgi:hypothetical protein